MRHSALLFLTAGFIIAPMAHAQMLPVRQQPTLVYEGNSTISAQPFYKRLQSQEATTSASVTAPDGAGILAPEERLPLSPTSDAVKPAIDRAMADAGVG